MTPWFTGREPATLAGYANVFDAYAVRHLPQWGKGEAFPDGYTGTAPVGTYKPNAFGLHDLHGNVWEWCRDWWGPYTLRVQSGDGLRPAKPWGFRVNRGGSYQHPARSARCANRNRNAPTFRHATIGLRPAREITR